MVKAVREAVGKKVDSLFGTHGQFTASGAIRMARRLEQYDPLWRAANRRLVLDGARRISSGAL
jgi:hypothetical protein